MLDDKHIVDCANSIIKYIKRRCRDGILWTPLQAVTRRLAGESKHLKLKVLDRINSTMDEKTNGRKNTIMTMKKMANRSCTEYFSDNGKYLPFIFIPSCCIFVFNLLHFRLVLSSGESLCDSESKQPVYERDLYDEDRQDEYQTMDF